MTLVPDAGSLTVKIVDRSGTLIRDIGSMTSASSITVVPTAADNTIALATGAYRRILLEWTETTDLGNNLPNKLEAEYTIRNLAGVS